MLTCGRDGVDTPLLGHAEDPDADPDVPRDIDPPTLVPSMQARRIVSVATSNDHCLALSAEGEIYSWGSGYFGALGHGDGGARAVPRRIETLSHIECIATGPNWTSAAVDEKSHLFTWGTARFYEEEDDYGELDTVGGQVVLGYELDAESEYQAIPKRGLTQYSGGERSESSLYSPPRSAPEFLRRQIYMYYKLYNKIQKYHKRKIRQDPYLYLCL